MLFNLLPVKSLDGWQILYCLGALTGGKEYQSKVLSAVSWLFTCGLLLVSVPLLIKNHNPTLLLFCLYIGVLQPMQQNRSA